MSIAQEILDIQNEYKDIETKQFTLYMCKKCKFYDNGCTKKRIIRECARKGLKNKD